jgi:glycosyltransferase involved in cell wall biosynthesis
MRDICVIGPGGADGQGGIGRHVRYVARHWAAHPARGAMRVLDSHGGSTRAMPARFAACLATLAGLLLRRRVGLVHVHMASNGSVVRKLCLLHVARLGGARVVLHVHGSTFAVFHAGLPRPARALLGWSMRRADAVIALGSFWRDYLVSRVGLDPARVHVMANAVPPASARAVGAPGTRCASCALLFLGRLGARKGTPDLLRALAALRDAGQTNWHLTCAGDGDIEGSRHQAAMLGLADSVTFTGWVDEARARGLLAAADALVLPSHHEGLPMAILEAMAHGLPVVTTPVGAIADVIKDGRNGLLVAPGDIAALQAALARIITSPAERQAMGVAGRADVTARHGLDAYCDRLEALYRGVLA